MPAAGAFKQQLLYQGGCLATERLHLLHGNAAVADTYEVIDVSAYSNLRCPCLYSFCHWQDVPCSERWMCLDLVAYCCVSCGLPCCMP